MATVKAVINIADRKLDGTCNAKIRITHNRKSRYIKTPFYVHYSDITKAGKIKDRIVADKLDEEVKRYRNEINRLGFVCDSVDVDGLIALIKHNSDTSDFIKYAEDNIDKLRRIGRNGTAIAYRTALNRLKEYCGNNTLPFSKMTKRMIGDFICSMSVKHKPTTVNLTICALKSIYNTAMSELNNESNGVKIVLWDCFEGMRIKTESASSRRSFKSIEQMQKVIDYIPDNFGMSFAKDMFVFSFVCLGMNMADIMRIRKTDIQDGILTFRRKKTESRMGDRCIMKVMLSDVAKTIISKYIDMKQDEFVFPAISTDMNWYVNERIKTIFRNSGIDDGNFVFYTARHSMATFARNICGIDMFTVNEMLDHSAPNSLKMTDVYVRRDYTHIWEANEKLLNLFEWSYYLQ